jgi:hypothetical protein
MSAIQLSYITKPIRGEPCNGCGLCCSLEVCGIGIKVLGLGTTAPCPALEYDNGRTFCGLIRNPAKWSERGDSTDPLFGHFSNMVSNALGIGKGCCSDDPHSEN